MNVLLIGSGGRESALAWKIAPSPRLTKLYAAPGNPGIADIDQNLDVKVSDCDGIIQIRNGIPNLYKNRTDC